MYFDWALSLERRLVIENKFLINLKWLPAESTQGRYVDYVLCGYHVYRREPLIGEVLDREKELINAYTCILQL